MHKQALVIGISDYSSRTLKTPINDAKAIALILEYKGFQVDCRLNLTSADFFSCLNNLDQSIKSQPDVILFYYAGHGVQINNKNYLLPKDYDKDENIDYNSPSLDFIRRCFDKVSKKAMKIIILDSCRNDSDQDLLNDITVNKTRSAEVYAIGGLAKEEAGDNTFISFATAPGSTASNEGTNGRNGLFTECILDEIMNYGSSIEDLFKKVREQVIEKSDYKQVPWEHSSLRFKFTFDNEDIPEHLVDLISLPFDHLYDSCFSKNSQSHALCGNSNIFVWRESIPSDGHYEITIGEMSEDVESLTMTRNHLCGSTSKGNIFLLEGSARNKVIIKAHHTNCRATDASSDEKIFVSCGDGNKVKAWGLPSLNLINNLSAAIDEIYSVSFMPGLINKVLIAGTNYTIEQWDIDRGVKDRESKTELYYTYKIAFNKIGDIFATGHEKGYIQLWSAAELKVLNQIKLAENIENKVIAIESKKDGVTSGTNNILSLSFSNSGHVLAAGTSQPSIVFIDVKYAKIIKEIKLDFPVDKVYSVAYSSDDRFLITTGHKSNAYLFSVTTRMPRLKWKLLSKQL